MTVTSAPMVLSPGMREPHTREWLMSPTMPTCRPSMRPKCLRIVYRSSSACVGCWCLPSPASMTGTPEACATWYGTPACLSRTTMRSTL